MKRFVIVPDGWPCTYGECPPGLFAINDNVCLKSQYGGEEDRNKLIVQPVKTVWEIDL